MSTQNDEEFFMSAIAKRLIEERKRLELTQEAIAKACDSTARTVISWEGGAKIPSHQLARMISVGVDAWYVLTGVRFACDSRAIRGHDEGIKQEDKSDEYLYESKNYDESHPSCATCDSSAIIARESDAGIGRELQRELAGLTAEQRRQVLDFIRDKQRLNQLEAQVARLSESLI